MRPSRILYSMVEHAPSSAWCKPCAAVIATLLFATMAASAQSPATAPSIADYQRSLGLREQWMTLTEHVAWPAQWLADGRFHYRRTVKAGFEFVIVDVATLHKQAAFDHARLAAALSKASGTPYSALRLPFEQIRFAAADGDVLRTLRFDIGGTPWRCDLSGYTCVSGEQGPTSRPRAFDVVRDLSVAANNAPRRSPDGQWEVYADGHDLVLRQVADGSLRRLTNDGRADAFYDPESIAWSPDSRRLATYRVQPGDPRRVTRVESSPADQLQPRVQTQLYPKPGDAVDIDRPVLIDIASGTVRVIDDALLGNAYLLSPLRWRADSASVSLDYTRRGFQQTRLIEVDANSGNARAPITEDSDSFIPMYAAYRHEVNQLGKEILWISERDGWRHLYLYDGVAGKVKRQLTHGKWVVRDVIRVDDDRRQVWFTASGRDAGKDLYFRHLYRVNFDGGKLTRLTTADADHDIAVSKDGRHYVDTYSRVDLAPVSELRRADGSLVAELERGDITALQAAGWKPPQVFVAKGRDGKTDIRGLVVRPRDYDPARRYPVIETIYAGPHSSFVPRTFWPFGHHSGGDKGIGMQAQADLGFIVVMIDGMGTAHRSKAFHDVAWRNLADSGFPDRIAWHRAWAAQDPSYDISRVGIYGASAGGQSSLNALLFHPDFYKVAVAYAGCYDNRMDKIWWNEQWLGWPVNDSYAAASGVAHAGKLQGDLLMIVGEQDSNVDPASTMQVADALIRANKDFELLVVPGAEHSVGRSSGPIDYVVRRQYDFFVRHLLGATPPSWNRAASSNESSAPH